MTEGASGAAVGAVGAAQPATTAAMPASTLSRVRLSKSVDMCFLQAVPVSRLSILVANTRSPHLSYTQPTYVP
ncbi:MAG: hypothetical protein ACR2IK_07065 [Chloroflexota bacterium]